MFVLGLVHVIQCYVSEPKKVSKQCGCDKVGRNSIILLHFDKIMSIIARLLLILSDIV